MNPVFQTQRSKQNTEEFGLEPKRTYAARGQVRSSSEDGSNGVINEDDTERLANTDWHVLEALEIVAYVLYAVSAVVCLGSQVSASAGSALWEKCKRMPTVQKNVCCKPAIEGVYTEEKNRTERNYLSCIV